MCQYRNPYLMGEEGEDVYLQSVVSYTADEREKEVVAFSCRPIVTNCSEMF